MLSGTGHVSSGRSPGIGLNSASFLADGFGRERGWPARRLENVMKTDHRLFGLILGGIVVMAAAIFILGGGEWGGKKTIEGDRDLPPVTSTDR
jgi:hypothetical protein